MRKMRVGGLAWAAALLCAAFAGSASAVEESGFDNSEGRVREIVAEAKRAARESRRTEPTASASAAPRASSIPEDQLERRIVVFKKSVSAARRREILQQAGASVSKDLRLIAALAVATPKTGIQGFEENLEKLPEIERIEPDLKQNWLLSAGAAPALPAVARPAPGLGVEPPGDVTEVSLRDRQTTPWGVEEVGASRAWRTTRGQGVKVAVVDTGIDARHPDIRVVGGVNVINQGSYIDDNGHGTHVAGTIGAMDNRQGVVGVAPEVDLYAVKVLDGNGSGSFSDVIAGIQWCAENGIQVANFSLGASRGTQALEDAVAQAVAAGVTIVAAAGNSGGAVGFPAAYPGAIAVGATDINGGIAEFSSRGPQVAVAAPGVDVLSTYPGGIYRNLSGTSMATPHIAGLAALAVAGQGLRSPQEVRMALIRAAQPMQGVPAEQQGAGIPDASRLASR